ncbi:MAG TPA: ComEC/Rec2 family competence protein, partial [Beijerinckiaceae bacterium]
MAWIDRGRNALTERIVAVIGGAQGAVAAALVTGKRGLIPEETNEALRAAGIYHVVSISGLHMVLAAGLFMWTMRAALALSPSLALRRPIKKWAAAFAMVGAAAYDLFSGAEVATERALVMMLVVLGAVLADRPAISMRNLAIAALIVLAREPVTLLGPSFQMSFAAVAAMIAAFERHGGAREPDAPPSILTRARQALLVMLATTLIAALATDPYATFHFHRITLYGLVGNALTLPLVEFVVMPAAVFGVLASAFGLDAPVWWVMGQGVGFMMRVAEHVATLPGAVRMIPAFGVGALLAMTLGLLWLTLWTTPLRCLGVAFAAAGVLLAGRATAPDVMIDARAQTLAFRGADGRLASLNAQANPFGVAQWLAGDADPRGPRDPTLGAGGRCDPMGCVGVLRDGRRIALTLDAAALPEDCARADILVTRHVVRGPCAGPSLVLDGRHFAAAGATHLHLAPEGPTLRTSRDPLYDR